MNLFDLKFYNEYVVNVLMPHDRLPTMASWDCLSLFIKRFNDHFNTDFEYVGECFETHTVRVLINNSNEESVEHFRKMLRCILPGVCGLKIYKEV